MMFWVDNCLHYACINFPVKAMCRFAFSQKIYDIASKDFLIPERTFSKSKM